MKKGLLLGLILALLCLFPALPCLAQSQDVALNERITVPGDGQMYAFTFTPTANNLYQFKSFGAPGARGILYLKGETRPIAQGEGFDFSARLIADASYTLRVFSPQGECQVEIMRSALGRCFSQPIQLTDLSQGYSKAIARAYDTHWYRFTAPVDGHYVIRADSAMNTLGYLLDEQGVSLARSDNPYGPYETDFCLEQDLEAGKTYLVRVSAKGEDAGQYQLRIAWADEDTPMPHTILPSVERITLEEGQQATLTYKVKPAKALKEVMFSSTDSRVARVTGEGRITALSAGEASILLRAPGGAQSRVEVTVTPVPVTGLVLTRESLDLTVDQIMDIPCQVQPSNASDRRLVYQSSDPQVARVTSRGQVIALSPGSAVITVLAQGGDFSVQLTVNVEQAPGKYRVLAMGMQRFQGGDYRLGAVNTTQGVYDVFSRQRYEGQAPQVTMKLDMTRAQAISAIRQAFEGATSRDVSILYINTHGGLTGRTSWIRFSDDKVLTAPQLKKELEKIPGKVVLLLDCCESGSFISPKAQRDFAGRMEQVFTGEGGSAQPSGKFFLLTSTSSHQESYRLLPSKNASESQCTTAFAQALCEGGGWDLLEDMPMRYRADLDQNQQVTLAEMHLYLTGRLPQLLGREDIQQAQAHPQGSPLVLFSR